MRIEVLDGPWPRPIKTEEEYNEAVQECDRLVDRHPVQDSAEWDRLMLVGMLIHEYEHRTGIAEPD
jgi:antitoxin component HigA of HigAB toxin-antitoxin module